MGTLSVVEKEREERYVEWEVCGGRDMGGASGKWWGEV